MDETAANYGGAATKDSTAKNNIATNMDATAENYGGAATKDSTAKNNIATNMDATAENYGAATTDSTVENYVAVAATMDATAENYAAMDSTAEDCAAATMDATAANCAAAMYAGAEQPQQQQQRPKRGRRQIVIEKIKKETNRNVTFSKRKKGLFAKATELSTLCGVDAAVVLFSQHDKPYCYGNPAVDSVLDRYLAWSAGNNNYTTSGKNSNNDSRARAEKQKYMEALTWLEEEKMAAKMTEKANMNGESKDFWWEAPVDGMQGDELAVHESKLQGLRNMVITRLNMLGC